MLGRSDLLAVHWLSPYEHVRIQRIAMVSPVLVQLLLLLLLRSGYDHEFVIAPTIAYDHCSQ